MKRITTTLAISSALALSASACKGGGAGAATKYIPDAAEFVGGMSVSGMISASGQKAEMEEQINKEAEAKEFIEAAKGCNLDPWNLDQVVFGGTSKEDVAVVIVGSGFGKADNITCISGKIKEKKGMDKDPMTVEGNKVTVDGGDGGRSARRVGDRGGAGRLSHHRTRCWNPCVGADTYHHAAVRHGRVLYIWQWRSHEGHRRCKCHSS